MQAVIARVISKLFCGKRAHEDAGKKQI